MPPPETQPSKPTDDGPSALMIAFIIFVLLFLLSGLISLNNFRGNKDGVFAGMVKLDRKDASPDQIDANGNVKQPLKYTIAYGVDVIAAICAFGASCYALTLAFAH